MKLRALMASLVVALVAAGAGTPAHALALGCSDAADVTYDIPSNPSGITGKFALPTASAGAPVALVAFAHGYSHKSASWVQHMLDTAAHGAVAFAVDYRGTYVDSDGSVRGWFVKEGAQDTIDVTRAFMAACPDLSQVFIYGVSMGGNTSGLAVAAGATRPDRSPLFDYWIAGEPAANVIETYLEATAVGPVNAFAQKAKADIEQEHGGPFAERPQSYVNGTVVARTNDIAASGIKGVAIVHGFDDGLVPYNQARELSTALRVLGVQTDFYNATFRETDGTPCGTDNTTLTENVLGPLVPALTGSCYTEPLAGHSTESSNTSLVVTTGLRVLYDMIDGTARPANHEFVVDGRDRSVTKLI